MKRTIEVEIFFKIANFRFDEIFFYSEAKIAFYYFVNTAILPPLMPQSIVFDLLKDKQQFFCVEIIEHYHGQKKNG